MDIYAYAQIKELELLAKENGIAVPRLRGYRLMSEEEPVSEEEIRRLIKENEAYVAKDLCQTEPFWDPNSCCSCFSDRTDRLCDYYLITKKTEHGKEYVGIRWDRIHGWKRKILKFELKKQARRIRKQFKIWNKYVGKDVLYIHARIGGNNWTYYKGDETVAKEAWFLDKVDDWFDSTYCDIYAKLK